LAESWLRLLEERFPAGEDQQPRAADLLQHCADWQKLSVLADRKAGCIPGVGGVAPGAREVAAGQAQECGSLARCGAFALEGVEYLADAQPVVYQPNHTQHVGVSLRPME